MAVNLKPELDEARRQLADMTARAYRAEGEAAGLKQALDAVGLAAKLADSESRVKDLQAELAKANDEIKACLVRAQQPVQVIQPGVGRG